MSAVFLSSNQPRDQRENSDFIGFIGLQLNTWASGSYKHEYCRGSPACRPMSCVCWIWDCLDSRLLMLVAHRGPCLHILYTWPTGGLLMLVIDNLFVQYHHHHHGSKHYHIYNK